MAKMIVDENGKKTLVLNEADKDRINLTGDELREKYKKEDYIKPAPEKTEVQKQREAEEKKVREKRIENDKRLLEKSKFVSQNVKKPAVDSMKTIYESVDNILKKSKSKRQEQQKSRTNSNILNLGMGPRRADSPLAVSDVYGKRNYVKIGDYADNKHSQDALSEITALGNKVTNYYASNNRDKTTENGFKIEFENIKANYSDVYRKNKQFFDSVPATIDFNNFDESFRSFYNNSKYDRRMAEVLGKQLNGLKETYPDVYELNKDHYDAIANTLTNTGFLDSKFSDNLRIFSDSISKAVNASDSGGGDFSVNNHISGARTVARHIEQKYPEQYKANKDWFDQQLKIAEDKTYREVRLPFDNKLAEYGDLVRNGAKSDVLRKKEKEIISAFDSAWGREGTRGYYNQDEIPQLYIEFARNMSDDEILANVDKWANDIYNRFAPSKDLQELYPNDVKKDLEYAEAMKAEFIQALKLIPYERVRNNADFEEKSKYKRKKVEYNTPFGGNIPVASNEAYHTYNQINSDKDALDHETLLTTHMSGANNDLKYNYLFEEEKKVYNYLFATKGEGTAQAYLDELSDVLLSRMAYTQAELDAEAAKKDPIGTSIASVIIKPFTSIPETAMVLGEFMDKGEINPNSSYYHASRTIDTTRSTVESNIDSGIGKFFYRQAINIGDMLASRAFGGFGAGGAASKIFTVGTQAAGSFTDTVMDATERGLSGDKAFALGVISAGAEMFFESKSFDSFFDGKTLNESGWKYFVNNLKTELAGELATEGVNDIADNLIAQDLSKWNLSIENYMSKGMSRNEAFLETLGDWGLKYAEVAGGTIISTSVMSGVPASISSLERKHSNKVYGEKVKSESKTSEFIDMASRFPENSETGKLYKSFADQGYTAENISAKDLGKLRGTMLLDAHTVLASESATADEKASAEQTIIDIEALVGNIISDGESGDIADTAESAVDSVTDINSMAMSATDSAINDIVAANTDTSDTATAEIHTESEVTPEEGDAVEDTAEYADVHVKVKDGWIDTKGEIIGTVDENTIYLVDGKSLGVSNDMFAVNGKTGLPVARGDTREAVFARVSKNAKGHFGSEFVPKASNLSDKGVADRTLPSPAALSTDGTGATVADSVPAVERDGASYFTPAQSDLGTGESVSPVEASAESGDDGKKTTVTLISKDGLKTYEGVSVAEDTGYELTAVERNGGITIVENRSGMEFAHGATVEEAVANVRNTIAKVGKDAIDIEVERAIERRKSGATVSAGSTSPISGDRLSVGRAVADAEYTGTLLEMAKTSKNEKARKAAELYSSYNFKDASESYRALGDIAKILGVSEADLVKSRAKALYAKIIASISSETDVVDKTNAKIYEERQAAVSRGDTATVKALDYLTNLLNSEGGIISVSEMFAPNQYSAENPNVAVQVYGKRMETAFKNIGLDISVSVYYDSSENAARGEWKKHPNGHSEIKLNGAKLQGEQSAFWVVSHELIHEAESKSPGITQRMLDAFTKMGMYSEEQFEAYKARYNAVCEAEFNKELDRGNVTQDDHDEFVRNYVNEEIVADLMSETMSSSELVEVFAGKLGEDDANVIVSFLKKLLSGVKKVFNSKDEFPNKFSDIIGMFEGAVKRTDTEGAKVNEVTENVGVQFDSESKSAAPQNKFSYTTWSNSEYVQNRDVAASALAKAVGVSKADAERYINNINSIAKYIADNKERLDYEPNLDEAASVLKSNQDYKWTVDMSTLCAKRLITTGTFDAIQKALPNTVFDSEDIVHLRDMLMQRGYEVACGICYVESTRRELGPITADFIERYKESQQTGKPIQRINSEGKRADLKKTKDQMATTKDKSTEYFYADKDYTPTLADLNTTDIDRVKVEHPLVYEAYLNFMNARGQAKPKLLETRAEYKGEILNHFKQKNTVNSRNNAGGLRLQSFSDFEIAHLIDMMQITLDMSKVGLMSQAYTKVPAFAEVFGGTGIKINLSLIAKDSGLDANGNLIFDDVEGINHEEAFRLRDKYSENVGTILVGKNDAHIKAAMADPRIDFIIPFHKSSWKESLYDSLGLRGYEDYTDTQHEKPLDKSRKIHDFQPSEYWDYSKSGDENADIYLKKCRDDGRIPKFPKFAGKPGYWKLLIDFKMYDNNGVGSPQTVVKPEFDMDSAMEIMKEYEGGHQKLPVAQDVVDDFVAEYKGETDGKTRFALTGNMVGSVPTYTDQEYRDFGWARENDIITAGENDNYRSKFAMLKSGLEKYKKTKRGEYIIPAYDQNDPELENINSVLVFAKGTIDKPIITSIIRIYSYNELEIDKIRRYIYDCERRGVQPKTGELFDRYDATDFAVRPQISASSSGYSSGDGLYRSGSNSKNNGTDKQRINYIDTEYLELAKNPEKNEARLREMVEEAAKTNGYSVEAYHGTNKFGFTDIDVSKSDDEISFFATNNPKIAGTYTGSSVSDIRPINYNAPDSDTIIDDIDRKIYGMKDRYKSIFAENAIDALRNLEYGDIDEAQTLSILTEGIQEIGRGFDQKVSTTEIEDAVSLFKDGIMTSREAWSRIVSTFDKLYDSIISEAESSLITSGDRYNADTKELVSFAKKVESALNIDEKGIYKFYCNTDNMLEIDAAGSFWNKINVSLKGTAKKEWTTRDLAKYAKAKNYSGVIIHNVVDSANLSVYRKNSDVFIFLEPGKQVKSADLVTYDDDGNIIPISERFNPEKTDIRYSLDDTGVYSLEDAWAEMTKKYGAIPKGEKAARDVKVPKKISDNKYVSRTARSAIEAGITPAEFVPELQKEILDGKFTYERFPDEKAEAKAKETIEYHGFEGALEHWEFLMHSGGAISKENFSLGIALYNQCAQNGDFARAEKILADLSVEATRAGQAIQSMRLLKKMSPDGTMYYLEKSIDKINDELVEKFGEKRAKKVKINEELARKYFAEKDAKKREKLYDELCKDIGAQVPSTFWEKADAWRYVAMLLNPTTHIRNVAGNIFNKFVIMADHAVEGALQPILVKRENRTRTWRIADRKTANFAKNDWELMRDVLTSGEGKYNNMMSDIDENRRILRPSKNAGKATKAVGNAIGFVPEVLRKVNSWGLEAEDAIFLGASYKSALRKIITARKLNVDNITPEQLSDIRDLAMKDALRATFREANWLAESISKAKSNLMKGNAGQKLAGVALGGVFPFTKTPMNITKQALEHSPLGVFKTASDIVKKARGGAVSGNDIIADLARTFTGTGLAVLGFVLARAGFVSAGDDEDPDKKRFDKLVGEQSYAITVGGKSYTIDWATPASIPFLVGAQFFDATSDSGINFKTAIDSLTKLAEPVIGLSMLDGLRDFMQSDNYAEGQNPLFAGAYSTLESYALQFIPTLGGKIHRIYDGEKKNYYFVDKNSNVPEFVQELYGSVASKLPFAVGDFQPSVDLWGRVENHGGISERLAENLISPGYYSEENYTEVDEELLRLYESTGNGDVFPKKMYEDITIDGHKYYMNAEHYTEAAIMLGEKRFDMLSRLFNDEIVLEKQDVPYSKMSDSEKAKIVSDVYYQALDETKYAMFDKVRKNSAKYGEVPEIDTVTKIRVGKENASITYNSDPTGKNAYDLELYSNADNFVYKSSQTTADLSQKEKDEAEKSILEYAKSFPFEGTRGGELAANFYDKMRKNKKSDIKFADVFQQYSPDYDLKVTVDGKEYKANLDTEDYIDYHSNVAAAQELLRLACFGSEEEVNLYGSGILEEYKDEPWMNIITSAMENIPENDEDRLAVYNGTMDKVTNNIRLSYNYKYIPEYSTGSEYADDIAVRSSASKDAYTLDKSADNAYKHEIYGKASDLISKSNKLIEELPETEKKKATVLVDSYAKGFKYNERTGGKLLAEAYDDVYGGADNPELKADTVFDGYSEYSYITLTIDDEEYKKDFAVKDYIEYNNTFADADELARLMIFGDSGVNNEISAIRNKYKNAPWVMVLDAAKANAPKGKKEKLEYYTKVRSDVLSIVKEPYKYEYVEAYSSGEDEIDEFFTRKSAFDKVSKYYKDDDGNISNADVRGRKNFYDIHYGYIDKSIGLIEDNPKLSKSVKAEQMEDLAKYAKGLTYAPTEGQKLIMKVYEDYGVNEETYNKKIKASISRTDDPTLDKLYYDSADSVTVAKTEKNVSYTITFSQPDYLDMVTSMGKGQEYAALYVFKDETAANKYKATLSESDQKWIDAGYSEYKKEIKKINNLVNLGIISEQSAPAYYYYALTGKIKSAVRASYRDSYFSTFKKEADTPNGYYVKYNP